MVSVDKAVIARLVKNGETFEVLVDPDKALAYRKGSPVSIDNILATSEIFKDSKKGDRPTAADLDKAFGKGRAYDWKQAGLDRMTRSVKSFKIITSGNQNEIF